MADFMTNSKTVSRQDLFHDDASSADGDGQRPIDDGDEAAAARAALEALLAHDLGMDLEEPFSTEPAASPAPEEPAPEDDGTAEFSFRLFSSSTTKKPGNQGTTGTEAVTQTVVLTDDTIDIGEGGLVNPLRPLSTYIADAPTSEQLAKYAVTAVDGAAIQAQAAADRRNAWGWEVPWRARTVVRVTKTELRQLLANALPASVGSAKTSTAALGSLAAQAANALPRWAVLPSPVSLPTPPGDASSHKCRPGKKRRILLRQRQKALAEKEAAAQTKEEHLQEKKKRLNRLKKLRKREKKREEKAAGGSQGGGDGNSSDGSNET